MPQQQAHHRLDLESFLTQDSADNETSFRDALRQALQHLSTGLTDEMLAELPQSDEKSSGVTQEFLDSLDRVSRKQLGKEDQCAICTSYYKDEDYILVVRLRCGHKFDLECVGPWLKVKPTCPLCRHDVMAKKEVIVEEDSEEEWDDTYS